MYYNDYTTPVIIQCILHIQIVQKVLVLAVTMEEQQLDAVKVFMESGASPNTTQYVRHKIMHVFHYNNMCS